MKDANRRSILEDSGEEIYQIRTTARGPEGALPFTDKMLRDQPSGILFGLTQNVGMGWSPTRLGGRQVLILGTQGGIRNPDGSPVALGFHTGHWEVGMLMQAAAHCLTESGAIPFAAFCSDPCDGRTNGTTGMFDSLPYRNDAAQVLRRLIRSLPTADGVLGVATCDKGLPAMMLALAGCRHLPGVIIPGGVSLLSEETEDLGKIQTIGARFAHGLLTLEEASVQGCRACASPGGGCQFLGTAATSQVVAEALGITLPHSALSPSGAPIWFDTARRSAQALLNLIEKRSVLGDILTQDSLHNALAVHAAFGGSTNLVLHLPAVAYAAGLRRPAVSDWQEMNRRVPRLVDALPNGPVGFATIQVFLAGGVPEVMLHLRDAALLKLGVQTAAGLRLEEILDWWEHSERRKRLRDKLHRLDGVDPDRVILSPARALEAGLTSTVTFPLGNLAPEGAVIKSTAIDSRRIDSQGIFLHEGRARVFGSEDQAIAAIKSSTEAGIRPGEIIVLAGLGPLGCGMPEIYQVTAALRHLPFGHQVAVLTDARFSGVSTGACVGHISPEALAGGPIGKVREGDLLRIRIDCRGLSGRIDLIGTEAPGSPEEGDRLLAERTLNPLFRPDPRSPDDTRLWAALQNAGGGSWAGAVYDVDRILEVLAAGLEALSADSK